MALLFVLSIIVALIQIIRERIEPEIPAENWANKELMHKDIMDCVPHEQIMKNLENGRYRLTEANPES